MTTAAQIKATAHRAGHTIFGIVELGDQDYYGWLKPSAFEIEDMGGMIITLIEDETGTIRNFPHWDGLRQLD